MCTRALWLGSAAGAGVAMMALPETGWLPQDVARLVFWVGAIVAASCAVGWAWTTAASWRRDWLSTWILAWHIKGGGIWPFHRLITIHDAAHYAYPRIKHRLDIQILEKLNKAPTSRLGMVAQFLLNGPQFTIPLYGSKPPFNSRDIIPKEDADTFMFSDDARELIDQYDENNKYTNIAMRWHDLKRRIRELKN